MTVTLTAILTVLVLLLMGMAVVGMLTGRALRGERDGHTLADPAPWGEDSHYWHTQVR
jgi:hypothetical protein